MNNNEQPAAILNLAIATVPKQPWMPPVELSEGLKRGTIFPNLYMPFYIGGEEHER